MLHVYRIFDLPYQSQVVGLAAILADLGDAWEHDGTRRKLERWYWNGVFGELYGFAVESRLALDFVEVPRWVNGGPEPSTVTETSAITLAIWTSKQQRGDFDRSTHPFQCRGSE